MRCGAAKTARSAGCRTLQRQAGRPDLHLGRAVRRAAGPQEEVHLGYSTALHAARDLRVCRAYAVRIALDRCARAVLVRCTCGDAGP